jgi:hypothetical protein
LREAEGPNRLLDGRGEPTFTHADKTEQGSEAA